MLTIDLFARFLVIERPVNFVQLPPETIKLPVCTVSYEYLYEDIFSFMAEIARSSFCDLLLKIIFLLFVCL